MQNRDNTNNNQGGVNLLKHINYLGESSLTTTQSIFVSILTRPNLEYIKSKLTELEQFLKLTEIEKQIIKETRNQIDVSGTLNPEYIINKFRYYFEAAPIQEIPENQIDYAILDKKVSQDKTTLSKELLDLANSIDSMGTLDIKAKLRELTTSKLITQEHTYVPDNSLRQEENAYEELVKDSGVYSMLLPEVEQHAGRAGVGHVVSILAFVGSFKSTYSLNLAYENAMLGYNVLYLSLESTSRAMISRLVLNHNAKTSGERKDLITQEGLRNAKLNKVQQQRYNNKHNEIVDLLGNNLVLWDSTDIRYNTFMEMTETLRAADTRFREKTGRGLEILVLDQLANLKHTDPGGVGKRYSYAGAVMDDWMTYFRIQTLNFLDSGRQITSFIVSQVRREAYAEASKPKNKGRYDASCGGDSNEIERTSDTMITLYKDLDTKNTLLVHIPKARHGSIPDNPIQVEVYGDYFHVGPLNTLQGETLTMEDFQKEDFKLTDLLKK